MNVRLAILLVEDDVREAVLIKHELRQAGYDVQCKRVQQLDEFVSALAKRLPDLILYDQKLQGLDGQTALTMARARYPNVPFIFLTGNVTDQLLQSGANACVRKDRMTVDLVSAIQGAVPKNDRLQP